MLFIAIGYVLQTKGQAGLVSAEQEARHLSTRLGHEVALSSSLRSELLYIAPHRAKAEVEADAVAEALHASFIKGPGGWIIKRTPPELRDIEQARTTERASWIRRAIYDRSHDRNKKLAGHSAVSVILSNLRRDLKAPTRRPTSQQEDSESGSGLLDCELLMPGAILLEGIVMRLTPERLASIPTGDYRIYETGHISPAEGLPNTGDLLDTYSQSMHAFDGSVIAQAVRERAVGAGGVFLTGFGIENKPEKVRLMVTTTLTGLSLSLELFDKTGSKICVADMFVSKPDVPSLPDIEARNVFEQRKSVWVPLTDAATRCATFLSGRGEFPDWFMYPERIEPLGNFVTEGLDWMADQSPTKCVVIDVPESTFSMAMPMVRQGRLDASAFQYSLADIEQMQTVSDDRFVAWRSRDPTWVEKNRSNRKELGSFARGVARSGWVDVRQEGLLIHSCRELSYIWREAARLGLSDKKGAIRRQSSTNPLVSLIGDISESDWRSLQSGRTMTVGELGVVHEAGLLLSLEPDILGGGSLSDLFRHPLEMYDGYRIEETPVSLKVQPLVVAQVETDSFAGDWCPLAELPSQMTHDGLGIRRSADLSRDTFEAYLEKKSAFNVGRRSDLVLTLGLPRGHYIEQNLPAPIEDVSYKLTYSRMPKVFRDLVWELFSRRVSKSIGN